MAQKIIKVGSSAGMIIPKALLQEIGAEIGDELDIVLKKNTLHIKPIRSKSSDKKKVAELTMNFINRYKADLDALKNK